MTGHIGTNTPKFAPPRWGRLPFKPLKRGCANSVVGFERAEKDFARRWPNTVSESTVSNTELSEFFALSEFWGASSVSSSRPIICVPKRTHRVFFFRRTQCFQSALNFKAE